MLKRTLLVAAGMLALAGPAAAQTPYGGAPPPPEDTTAVLDASQVPVAPQAPAEQQPQARTDTVAAPGVPLPRTGDDPMGLVRIGMALVAAGGLTLYGVRRRPSLLKA